MKNALLIIVALLGLAVSPMQACDICGCGVGGYYSGMLPQYHKHFIGLRWRFSQFKSYPDHHVNPVNSVVAPSKEYFHSFELMARFYPHRRVQLLAFVPLNYNYQHTPLSPPIEQALVGLGDVSLMALYNIYNTSFIAEKDIKHNVLLGGGIKLPTGAFQRTDESGNQLTPNFQLGTGSVDFLVTGIYTFRYKRWGVNTNINYKINLPNAETYRFGNQLKAALTAFMLHKFEKTKWGILPQLGLAVEQAGYNFKNGYQRINTGGQQLLATVGVEAYCGDVQFSATYQQPIWQHLSDGYVEAGPQFMVGINYLFGRAPTIMKKI